MSKELTPEQKAKKEKLETLIEAGAEALVNLLENEMKLF